MNNHIMITSTKTLSITRKWFPLQGERADLNQKSVVSIHEPILIRSTQAAGIVRDTYTGEDGEGEGGEEETTGGYFYCSGWKIFHFLALEFLLQKRTRACALETDVRICKYLKFP